MKLGTRLSLLAVALVALLTVRVVLSLDGEAQLVDQLDQVRQSQTQIAPEQHAISAVNDTLATQTRRTVVVVPIVLAALMLAILFGIIVPLKRSLTRLMAMTRRIAAGDLVTPVTLPGPGDLQELGGAIDSMRSQLRDQIAQHERDADALRTSDEHYRALFARSPLPMWVADEETLRFIDVNEAMVALLGFSRDELLAMQPESNHNTGVTEHRCKNGGLVELDLTSHTIVVRGRQCMLTVGVDVTNARRAEEQLRHAHKMEAIGQLAGGVSHDFNNLLAVIQLNAESVAMELGPDHQVAEELREIAESAQRGAGLTRQLLAFSRQQRVTRKPIDLNATIREVYSMLGRVVGEQFELSANLWPHLGAIEADAGQIEQVLLNLVLNARDAMSSGGRISITTSEQLLDGPQAVRIGVKAGAYVAIDVTDTGCGIDASTRARIFEPYFTTKEVGKGSGLGLANVFALVKSSSGAVTVQSEPGMGTTFRLYFPRVDGPVAGPAPHVPEVTRRGSETILIVEDDAQLRAASLRLIRSWGYRCLEAPTGDAALQLVRDSLEHIDLVLSDVVMPGHLDGRALAAQVQALRPGIKVVLMSGYTEHMAVRTAARDDLVLVHKPFTSVALSAAIRAELDAPNLDVSTRSSPVAASEVLS